MVKRIILTLLGLILIVGAIAGVKFLQIRTMIEQGGKQLPPPETVTAGPVRAAAWGSSLTATGSTEAVQGVTVAAELAGKVVRISFEPGSMVKQGDLLVKQDTEAEEAQLRAIMTTRGLAQANLKRMTALLREGLIAQADFDKSEADFKDAVALADNIRAAIAKKTIRAPFAGRLGIRLINLGQILREADPIVSLQVMDPIFVSFQLPQQDLAKIRTGLDISLGGDTLGKHAIKGAITTINPEVDPATRNLRVQATVANTDGLLRAGMFVTVAIILPGENRVLTIPATAVLYAPYGDSVFVVEEKKDSAQSPPQRDGGKGTVSPIPKSDMDKAPSAMGKVLRQQFVRLGEKRGDFVAITEGVKEGEMVVTTGVFKLRNGQAVVVDNTLVPQFKLAPKPENN